MTIKNTLLLTLLTGLLTTVFTCKSPTEPCTDCPQQPDTTSQNFTFETFEFGDGFSSSYLNDVWIFDENNIWAVGWIQQNEFQGNCNIMRWNGTKWNYVPSSGVATSSGLTGIWALDTNHIYFANNSVGEYKNGQYQTFLITGNWVQGQAVTKLWGSSSSNIWGVGPWGTVVHYDGLSWKKVDFDTQWYFYNVTGNKSTGVAYALAVNSSSHGVLVRLENNSVQIIRQTEDDEIGPDDDLEMIDNSHFVYGDYKIKEYDVNTGKSSSYHNSNLSFSVLAISSFHRNDVYFWGASFAEGIKLVHYNGSRLKEMSLPWKIVGQAKGVFADKDFALTVGYAYNKALIIKTKRRPI